MHAQRAEVLMGLLHRLWIEPGEQLKDPLLVLLRHRTSGEFNA
jgi:hypothetical protein